MTFLGESLVRINRPFVTKGCRHIIHGDGSFEIVIVWTTDDCVVGYFSWIILFWTAARLLNMPRFALSSPLVCTTGDGVGYLHFQITTPSPMQAKPDERSYR